MWKSRSCLQIIAAWELQILMWSSSAAAWLKAAALSSVYKRWWYHVFLRAVLPPFPSISHSQPLWQKLLKKCMSSALLKSPLFCGGNLGLNSVFLSPFFILFYKLLSGREVSNCLQTMQSYMEVLQAQQAVCFTCCKEKGARTSCLPLCFQRSKKSKSVASGILK